jgi:hypothetical protein
MNGYSDNELRMRNNNKVRRLFAEIMCVLCDAKRKHSFDTVKIKKEDFDMTQMRDKFKAPSNKYAQEIFLNEDPKELFPAVNEIAYNISEEGKNIISACYWLEWIMEFETICKGKKEKIFCERRNFSQVESKSQKDIIWIIWDALLYYSEQLKPKNPFIENIMKSLKELFCIKYTTGSCKKRRYLLYFAVALLTEPVPMDVELISKKEMIHNVVEKINEIYKQIKKNETGSGMDYLFQGVSKEANFQRMIQKLEMMGSGF